MQNKIVIDHRDPTMHSHTYTFTMKYTLISNFIKDKNKLHNYNCIWRKKENGSHTATLVRVIMPAVLSHNFSRSVHTYE